jgi:hypothetical protein
LRGNDASNDSAKSQTALDITTPAMRALQRDLGKK